jgi:hypothetical protein
VVRMVRSTDLRERPRNLDLPGRELISYLNTTLIKIQFVPHRKHKASPTV